MSVGSGVYAWRRDGQAWRIEPAGYWHGKKYLREPGLMMDRLPGLDGLHWQAITRAVWVDVGLRRDGSLWTWRPVNLGDPQYAGGATIKPLRVGQDQDWVQIAGCAWTLLGLKADGSLWSWAVPFRQDREYELAGTVPMRLGQYRDWVALGWHGNHVACLAGDGSIWRWPAEGENSDQPMLAPSRRPVRIASLFGDRP
jgi:hypothetical protein